MSSPLLSVVVPIYNVGSYLAPCLDSLLLSTLADVEIICVDDGSTDGSGEVADLYQHRDPRIRVVHVENGGLGRARNIGIDAARGRYLAFADSDDRVPSRAYEQLCGSLENTGSDIAAGRVRRFTDTRSWHSGLHNTAIPRAARATHIRRMTSLVYDTTAWNKVFRRSFWDANALRFPEGVLYEDMPVTVPAHLLAGSVDLLTSIVYEWRERGDGSMSITQRRAELKNLQDRLTALEFISDFLVEHEAENVLQAQDRKVLSLDIPLYLGVLDIAEAEFRRFFAKHVRQYLEHVDPATLAQLEPWNRVAFELLRRDRIEETVQLIRDRNATKAAFAVRRKGTHLLAELPYLGDASIALPDAVYDVTTKLPVRATIDEPLLRGTTLVLTGVALIHKVPLARPWSAIRYVELRDGTGHRIVRPAWPRPRPDATAVHGTATADYAMAGYEVHVPLTKLRAPDRGSANYAVQMKIVTPAARRGVPLARGAHPRGRTPLLTALLPDGTYTAVYTSTGAQLRIAMQRDYALVDQAALEGRDGTLTCSIRLARPLEQGGVLRWRTLDGELVDGLMEVDPGDPLRVTARVRLDVQSSSGDHTERIWRGAIEYGAADEPAASTSLVTTTDAELVSASNDTGLRELAVGIGGGGRLTVTDRPARVEVIGAQWRRGNLVVTLRLPPRCVAAETKVALLRRSGGNVADPTIVDVRGEELTVEFSVLDPPRTRSLPPGTWTLQVSDPAEEAMPLQIDERSCQAGQAGTDQPVAVVRTSTGQLSVVVWSTREADRGAFNQARLQRVDYARARRTSLRNTVLFQSWAGKQYSDSPRAVYEEMVRQGRDEPALWVRRDSSVDLPDGTPSVLYGSREYYEALATARYVVANDAMPTFYDKRPGSFYLQTWHGTPLKRIGFDIENAQFGNVNYLSEFAVEVTKWDRLVSPNRFSSEIFRRAFDYRGEILETGYPRNDVFYAPDVDQRRAQVRRQLGLHPDQRVILWAPTWREDQRDGSGRYTLPLPFDLGTWDRILGPNDILLFRGHQLIQHSVGGMLRGLRQVRNVTLYPDIQDLYLAADLLITDYSSVMFDFANTRRPMIFYAWDLEHYRDHLRGFYLDFESTVPGPVITDLDSLRDHLAAPNPADHEEAYRRFVERFCSLEDGHASERVLKAVLDHSGD